MNRHFEIIMDNCFVIDMAGDYAIYYIDGGYGYAEILQPDGSFACWSCGSLAEFRELCEIAF